MAPRPSPATTPTTQIIAGSPVDDDLFDQFEWVRTVNTSDDRFSGGDGDDTITSWGGTDVIDAGAGDDSITTRGGTAIIDGGAGVDSADVSMGHRTTDLTVNGNVGANRTATFSDGTVIANVESVRVFLGAGNDVVALRSSLIAGGAGNDRLTQSGGDGALDGDAGDDVLAAGGGDNSLSGGDGADLLNAGGGHDLLRGGFGLDTLSGGRGNDALTGGAGADRLSGGAGADAFTIDEFFGSGIDRVVDFNFAEGDRIDHGFRFFDPEGMEGDPLDSVVTDPVGQGFLTVTQAAEGVLIALVADPGAGLLIVGATLADYSSDWIV